MNEEISKQILLESDKDLYLVGRDSRFEVDSNQKISSNDQIYIKSFKTLKETVDLGENIKPSPDGSFSYNLSSSSTGLDNFNHKITDFQGRKEIQTVVFEVKSIQDLPRVSYYNQTRPEEQTLAKKEYEAPTDSLLIVNSNEGLLEGLNQADLGLSVENFSQRSESGGYIEILPDGSFAYKAPKNFDGIDTFVYTVVNSNDTESLKSARVYVHPKNESIQSPKIFIEKFNPAPFCEEKTTQPEEDPFEPPDPKVPIDIIEEIINPIDDNPIDDPSTPVPVNNPPVALDNHYLGYRDSTLTIPNQEDPGRDLILDLLGNDSDPDGDSLIITSNTNPIHGTVTVNSDGSFVYNPNFGYHGSDSFTYTVSDGKGGVDTATVNLTISSESKPPRFNYLRTNESGTTGDINLNDYIFLNGEDHEMSYSEGNNYYIFKPGDDQNRLIDSGGNDYLDLSDYNYDEATFFRIEAGILDHLEIEFAEGGQITIENYFADGATASGEIEQIIFADQVIDNSSPEIQNLF